MDRLTVQTEVRSDIYSGAEQNPWSLERLRERIAAGLRRALGVSLTVELRPAGKYERTQFKARRVIDRRRY
jgi:phenylacetate-CoA ligase